MKVPHYFGQIVHNTWTRLAPKPLPPKPSMLARPFQITYVSLVESICVFWLRQENNNNMKGHKKIKKRNLGRKNQEIIEKPGLICLVLKVMDRNSTLSLQFYLGTMCDTIIYLYIFLFYAFKINHLDFEI